MCQCIGPDPGVRIGEGATPFLVRDVLHVVSVLDPRHVWLAKSGFFQVGFNYGDYLDYFTTRDAKDCQVYI